MIFSITLSNTFVSNAALPDDGLSKETGGSKNISFSFNRQLKLTESNVSLPYENVVTQYSTHTNTQTYFYNSLDAQELFKTEKDVYAYKIAVYRNSFSAGNWINIDELKLAVGTKNEMSDGTVQRNGGISADQESIYWIVTDYSDGEKIYASLFTKAHELVSAYKEGTDQSIVYPFLNVSAGFQVSWAKYNYDDYVAAIYEDFQDLLGKVQESNNISSSQLATLNNILAQLEALNLEEDKQSDSLDDSLVLQEENNETQKGIFSSIKDFFGSFFQNLIETIVGVIVPSSEDMSSLFERLNQFFSDTFGFLYFPFDFIVRLFNVFLSADSSTALTFPGFSIMGYQVWSNQTYDLASNSLVNTICGYVRIGTGGLLAFWFVGYLRNFFEKRFGGGGA